MKTFSIEAIRDFEHDYERAVIDLRIAIESIVGDDEYVEDEIFVKDDKGVTSVDETELHDLLERPADAPIAVTRAFEEFGWQTRRAFHALKETLAREPAEG